MLTIRGTMGKSFPVPLSELNAFSFTYSLSYSYSVFATFFALAKSVANSAENSFSFLALALPPFLPDLERFKERSLSSIIRFWQRKSPSKCTTFSFKSSSKPASISGKGYGIFPASCVAKSEICLPVCLYFCFSKILPYCSSLCIRHIILIYTPVAAALHSTSFSSVIKS